MVALRSFEDESEVFLARRRAVPAWSEDVEVLREQRSRDLDELFREFEDDQRENYALEPGGEW